MSSISLASSLVGNALKSYADQFAAITGGKVEELTSSLAVMILRKLFCRFLTSKLLEQLVADFEQIKVADPSAVMPVFSADLDANPLQAGLLYQLSELSHELAVPGLGALT